MMSVTQLLRNNLYVYLSVVLDVMNLYSRRRHVKIMRWVQVIKIIYQARDSRERLIEYPSVAKGRQISHVEVISRPGAPSSPINSWPTTSSNRNIAFGELIPQNCKWTMTRACASLRFLDATQIWFSSCFVKRMSCMVTRQERTILMFFSLDAADENRDNFAHRLLQLICLFTRIKKSLLFSSRAKITEVYIKNIK